MGGVLLGGIVFVSLVLLLFAMFIMVQLWLCRKPKAYFGLIQPMAWVLIGIIGNVLNAFGEPVPPEEVSTYTGAFVMAVIMLGVFLLVRLRKHKGNSQPL